VSLRGKAVLKTLMHYRSFIIGLAIIAFFIGLSIYAIITWPYDQAITMWNDPSNWRDYPELAPPAWIQMLTGRKEIEGTLTFDTTSIASRYLSRKIETYAGGLIKEVVNVTIIFDYDAFPKSGYLQLNPMFTENITQTTYIGVKVRWVKPNGVVLTIYDGKITIMGLNVDIPRVAATENDIVKDFSKVLRTRFNVTLSKGIEPIVVLFIDEHAFVESNQSTIKVLKGRYVLQYEYFKPTQLKSLEARLKLRGTVYGLLGTDSTGRDLFMGVAWGTPIALLFGLLASVLTTLLTMSIAAIVAWFRGVVDEITSRINEIFMVIPFLPLLIMIMLFYGFTLWTLLALVIALNTIGGGAIKTYRAMFLQIREMPYIEAAKAYGASSWRIIFRYIVPKVLPTLIPSIVLSVPSFVFLEAALALLGISDPRIISWGKILEEALEKAALFAGAYHWVLAPSAALILLSLAFAMIGFTLDRVFNPRLRQV